MVTCSKERIHFHTSPGTDEYVGITVPAIDGGVVSNYLQKTNGVCDISPNGVGGDFTIELHPDDKRQRVMFAVKTIFKNSWS